MVQKYGINYANWGIIILQAIMWSKILKNFNDIGEEVLIQYINFHFK